MVIILYSEMLRPTSLLLFQDRQADADNHNHSRDTTKTGAKVTVGPTADQPAPNQWSALNRIGSSFCLADCPLTIVKTSIKRHQSLILDPVVKKILLRVSEHRVRI